VIPPNSPPPLPGLKALCRVHGPFIAKAKTLEEFNKADEWCPLCLLQAERAREAQGQRRRLKDFSAIPCVPSGRK
jgi:hypothetical protein